MSWMSSRAIDMRRKARARRSTLRGSCQKVTRGRDEVTPVEADAEGLHGVGSEAVAVAAAASLTVAAAIAGVCLRLAGTAASI